MVTEALALISIFGPQKYALKPRHCFICISCFGFKCPIRTPKMCIKAKGGARREADQGKKLISESRSTHHKSFGFNAHFRTSKMSIKAKARKSDETFGFNWCFRTPKNIN